MRLQHKAHPLPSFPVYTTSFLTPTELVVGGGGGSSKSGIKNKLRLYTVGNNRSLELKDEYELAPGEDAPMSMAASPDGSGFVCGVNSVQEQLTQGKNENCRAFKVTNGKVSLSGTCGTLVIKDDEDDFQKVTVLSPDGKLLAVAGSRSLHLLSYPSLSPISRPVTTEKEIYDATFSKSKLIITTTANLQIYSLPQSSSKSKKKGKAKSQSVGSPETPLDLDRIVEIPESLGGSASNTFRAARYYPENDRFLYTVINSIPSRSRSKKSAPRKSFICKWNTESWTVDKIRKVGDLSLTCFSISPNGKFLGYGSSDLTIGILDAATLNPVATILKAHELPLTTVAFNPESKLLVSGSADNSIRVVTLPESVGGSNWGLIVLLILTILILLVAFALQK